MLSSKEGGVLSQGLTDLANLALPDSLGGLKQHLDPAWSRRLWPRLA